MADVTLEIPAFLKWDTPENKKWREGSTIWDERNAQIETQNKKTSEPITLVLNRRRTVEAVEELLAPLVTATSKCTKGSLMRYVRENFKHKSIYADVGKVASKIINQNTTGRYASWHVATTARYIRRK